MSINTFGSLKSLAKRSRHICGKGPLYIDMDTVKFGRTRVKVGDCVSVANDYFGLVFKDTVTKTCSFFDRIYGRVESVVDGNDKFVVRWDYDQELSTMNLEKVRVEKDNIPLQQQSSSLITKEDFSGLENSLEQGSSIEASKSHALLEEDFKEILDSDKQKFTLFTVKGRMKDECMLAELIPCETGTLIHNKPLLANQHKYLILEVFNQWEGFNPDTDTPGSYIAWDKNCATKVNDDIETKTSKSKKKNKISKRKNGLDQGKQNEEETVTKKKAKQRKTRKAATKVAIGKKAADKIIQKKRKLNEDLEEENILDYEEDEGNDEIDENEDDTPKWKLGGWNIDPRGIVNIPGAHLMDPLADLFEDDSYVDYLLTFLPVPYMKEVMIPATTKFCKDNGFEPYTFDEVINIHGIFLLMEIIRLPERRMYWSTEAVGMIPAFNFGKVISLHRFETFLNVWQLSENEDMDQQVLDFIDAINKHLKKAMRAGEYLCMDESMIKAYHKGLNGKMKIIRKPRPIGNELKTVSDAKSNIVLHMELHESKDDMADKEYMKEYGATTACSLRITKHWKGSGRVVIGDSWFGSLKTCRQLYEINGLYSNMLVKTAHKGYPRVLLRQQEIERGVWVSATAEVGDLKVMATRFLDLQEKLFITSCSTSLAGPPRLTKYHGAISRPQVAYDYLSSSASIDVHNHFRTGSVGLEDVWKTKNSNMRQVGGVLGFIFTNAYLAKRFFQKSTIKHCDFKIKLGNALCKFKEATQRAKRLSIDVSISNTHIEKVHLPKLLERPKGSGKEGQKGRYQKYCYYCQHNPATEPVIRKTSYYCEACLGPNGEQYPLCHPDTGRECMKLHIINGMPTKRRFKKD